MCEHAQADRRCGNATGSCQYQRPAPSQPVHTSGYLQTVGANVPPPRVPAGGLNLDDDTPLAGGACGLDDACEVCQ
jgi:hypothetical protein